MVYSSSVDIRPEWAVVEQIPFSALAKLHFVAGEAEDLAFCGHLQYYDKTYDRVTPKADKPLRRTRRVFRQITASNDPILRWAPLPFSTVLRRIAVYLLEEAHTR